jgi:hypothetical protein
MVKHRRKTNKRSRRPINDQPQNNTNIRIKFRKAITFNFVPDAQGSNPSLAAVPLNPSIANLTLDLSKIYRLYRFTEVHFQFQAALVNSTAQARYAINYLPAEDSQSAIVLAPPQIEEYEGPAVGFWQDGRGTPYMYRVPTNVLNAMPLNWYESKTTSVTDNDLTQGFFIASTTFPSESKITALATFVVEFQTLLEPSFLAAKIRDSEQHDDDNAKVVSGQNGHDYDLCAHKKVDAHPILIQYGLNRNLLERTSQ